MLGIGLGLSETWDLRNLGGIVWDVGFSDLKLDVTEAGVERVE